MKNLIRTSMTLVLLAVTFIFCHAQEFYRGEMFVTGQYFSMQDDLLNIEISIDFEQLRMPADEFLTLTPILKDSENEQELPAVQINGAEKQKAYEREQALPTSKRNTGAHPLHIPTMVVSCDNTMSRSFTYEASIPYKPWMGQAILLLRSQECACHGRKGDVYEDKIADSIRMPRIRESPCDANTDARFLSLVNFIEPTSDRDTLHCLTGSIPYFDREAARKHEKQFGELSEEKQNFEIYYQLFNALRSMKQQAGTELAKVKVTGYGSPTGNLKRNEVNARARARKLKEYLHKNHLTGKAPLEVTWVAEDWNSITSLIQQSDMTLREVALDLINNVDIYKGRERMLMALANGKSYKYLAEKIFPKVMRVDYRIEYTRKPLDAAVSLHLLYSGKQHALHLNEFFAVANSHPVGSTEYNDVLDLAARLFPDSPEANINAAAVALSKKELHKARKYLERFATLPMAYNNMGILYLLEGNRDKAEVYLTMAAATGVEQAKRALEELRR